METETQSREQSRNDLAMLTTYPDVNVGDRRQTGYRVDTIRSGMAMFLTGDELAAIVQLAYDHAGILAEPSLTAEAERAPGTCPCDLPGCSDRWQL